MPRVVDIRDDMDKSVDPDIEDYKKSLISSRAILVARTGRRRYKLRNQTLSNIYINHGALLYDPHAFAPLVRAMGNYIASNFRPEETVLINVDSKSSPQLTALVAHEKSYRQITILPKSVAAAESDVVLEVLMPEEHQDLGHVRKAVIIDDVLTPGDVTALKVFNLIKDEFQRRLGLWAQEIEYYLVVGVLRDPKKAKPPLEKQGLYVHGLLTLKDLVPQIASGLNHDQKSRLQKEFPQLGSTLR